MSERLRNVKAKLGRIPLAVDVHPREPWKPLEPLDRKKGHVFKQIRRNVRQVKENFQQLRKDIKNRIVFEVQRASRDIELTVREGRGPAEFTLVDVIINDSERHVIPGTERTFVINEGERITVGSYDKVAVVGAKQYIPEEISEPSLPHQEVVFQTR
jgi:hypothetical protein